MAMSGVRRLLLAVVVCFGIADAATAQIVQRAPPVPPAPVATPLPDTARIDPERGGLGLRMQVELLPPPAAGTKEDLPVFLDADRIEGVQGKRLDAVGNVELRRRGQRMSSDQLTYLIPENTVTASGHVRFRRLGDLVTGDTAYYDMNTDAGYIENPAYRFADYNARGHANRLDIRDRDRYRAQRATYTNCDVGDDDWYLKVNRLDMDRLKDVGVAHHATVYFQDVPILYSPWMDFPLSGRRKSGFLPPAIGTTNNSGFEVAVPYYWNIAPNQDYTVTPRIMAKRGMLIDNEYRYLTKDFNGELRGGILPDDRETGTTRWSYLWKHNQTFAPRLTGNVNIQGVSDPKYFIDLSNQVAATSTTILPREGSLTYNGDYWNLLARYQSFQTLQNPPVITIPPYARAPQLLLNADKPNVKGFNLGFLGEIVNFQNSNYTSGIRQVYYPSVSYPFGNSFVYFTPKVGYNYTVYTYPDGSFPTQTRSLPIVSVNTGMNFARDTGFLGKDYTQTLEPQLYYLYIPFRDQSQLPLYDTTVGDFNLAYLFAENRFTWWDRINNANALTAAVTSRLIDPVTGIERLRGTVAQRYFFTPEQVRLLGSGASTAWFNTLPLAQQQQLMANDTLQTNRSDLLLYGTGYLLRSWWLDTGLQYDVNNGLTEQFGVLARYNPQPNKVLNLGYRYTRNLLEQVDLSGEWPLSRRWIGLARFNYSITDSSLLEGLIGLEYNAGCWAARFVIHDFITADAQRSKAFFLQFELSGLSSIGNNPLQLLSQSISGYQRTTRTYSREPYYPGMPGE